jgi:hypothetical protein
MDPRSRALNFLSFLSDVAFLITWTTVVEGRSATDATDSRSDLASELWLGFIPVLSTFTFHTAWKTTVGGRSATASQEPLGPGVTACFSFLFSLLLLLILLGRLLWREPRQGNQPTNSPVSVPSAR